MRKFFEQLIIFIRPLWFSRFGLFGGLCGAYYGIRYAVSRWRGGAFFRAYIQRKAVFDDISCIGDLIYYFREVYAYKPDPLGGTLDHHASAWEFFATHGDCDDMALFAILALQRLNKGYGDRYECYFATIFPPSIKRSHNDCFFYDRRMEQWFAFNYGKLIQASTKELLLQAFCYHWCKGAPEEVNIYLRKR